MKNLFNLILMLFTINTNLISKMIHIEGSSTILPIMRENAVEYSKKNNVQFSINGGGSEKGIECILKNRCEIGMVSRALSEEEKNKDISVHLIGYDGIALIVNKENPITNLSTKDIQNLYSGKTTNWKELNGNNQEIILIAKRDNHSTRELFDVYFNINKLSINADFVGANIEGIVMVALEKNAITYVSIGTALKAIQSGANIKILNLNDIPATLYGKLNTSYPFVRHLNLITKVKIDKKIKDIISTIYSDVGKEIIINQRFIPYNRIHDVK